MKITVNSPHFKTFAAHYYKKFGCKDCWVAWKDCPFHKIITNIFISSKIFNAARHDDYLAKEKKKIDL